MTIISTIDILLRVSWTVNYRNNKVARAAEDLPRKVAEQLIVLIREMRLTGPTQFRWPNYGKLNTGEYHCHLRGSSRPRYVVVWEVVNKEIRIIEITYVGTHEGAPY